MLVQVIAKPYVDDIPGLKVIGSISRLFGRIQNLIAREDWSMDNIIPLLHKIFAMSSEIDILKPLLKDYAFFSTILGKKQMY